MPAGVVVKLGATISMEGSILATINTDRSTTRARPRWGVAATGVVTALLAVVLLLELQNNWSFYTTGDPNSEALLLWTAVMAAVAAFVSGRFPVWGLWAGGTLACLVVLGLLLGGPQGLATSVVARHPGSPRVRHLGGAPVSGSRSRWKCAGVRRCLTHAPPASVADAAAGLLHK